MARYDLLRASSSAAFCRIFYWLVSFFPVFFFPLCLLFSSYLIWQMLGGCLVSAGHKKHVLKFNKAVTAALSSLMVITAVALILPTVLYSTFMSMDSSEIGDKIVSFSRGTAVVLLILYSGYLYFQLKTHSHLFIGSQKDGEATMKQRMLTTPLKRRNPP